MFTVCPKCTLTLVVTTVDLRAGQGYVRCGRCSNVFNALIALREGDPNTGVSDTAARRLRETQPQAPVQPAMGAGVAVEQEPPAPAEMPVEETAAEEPAQFEEPAQLEEPMAEEIVVEESSVEESVAEEAAYELSAEGTVSESLEFDPSATDVSEIFIQPTADERDIGSGNYESIVLQEEPTPEPPKYELEMPEQSHTDTVAGGDWSLLDDSPAEDPPADSESIIEQVTIEAPAETSTPAQPDPPWVEEMFAEAEAEAERVRTAEREALSEADAEEPNATTRPPPTAPTDAQLAPLLARTKRLRPKWQYVAGVALLAFVLLVQIIHANRQRLVLSASLGPTISRVYDWFGVTLTPLWDLSAYSVKQLGAETEGGEGTRLSVRLSVHNESERVQPLPLLRLTLQDRYGNAVATRDLEPNDYLPKSATHRRLLEPDQRIDAELHVIDPGKAAIGFEIDACLRGENGAIGCANEARRRTAG